MEHLKQLEADSIQIIREAYYHAKPLAMLWSMGKDSNVMLWLAKKAFFNELPFTVILLDTGEELEEVYEFRDKYVKEWNLNYINATCPPIEKTDQSLPEKARMASRKTLGLKQVINENNFKGILLGIRRDEQAIRGKERIFSVRNKDGIWSHKEQAPEFWGQYQTDLKPGEHLRIHPLLAWSELDIWQYIKQENIPIVPLYFARDGMRYRSLGEKNITKPIKSTASDIDEIIEELKITITPERAGRTMDNESEDAFEKLRTDGYM